MYDNEEDAREATLTREQAINEVAAHDASIEEFLEDVGDRSEYEGYEILDWLGY
jgi:hypothetical protein